MINLTELRKKLAQNVGNDLILWYEDDLRQLMQPEQIPDGSTEEVKAYKMHLLWLKDKINKIKQLQKEETNVRQDEEYREYE